MLRLSGCLTEPVMLIAGEDAANPFPASRRTSKNVHNDADLLYISVSFCIFIHSREMPQHKYNQKREASDVVSLKQVVLSKVMSKRQFCHSGLSGIFLVFSEGFPTRSACGNDIPFDLFITPVICETLR